MLQSLLCCSLTLIKLPQDCMESVKHYFLKQKIYLYYLIKLTTAEISCSNSLK